MNDRHTICADHLSKLIYLRGRVEAERALPNKAHAVMFYDTAIEYLNAAIRELSRTQN